MADTTTRWTSSTVALLMVMAMAWVAVPAHADSVGGTTPEGFVWEADDDDVATGATIVDYTGTETDVDIPSTITDEGLDFAVTTIGSAAFFDKGLTSVTIPDSVTVIESGVNEGAFRSNSLTSVEIPDSVTLLGSNAFRYNSLSSVVIGSAVETIGISTFSSNSLTSIELPDGLTTIGNAAFSRNDLENVVLPSSVESIGLSTFANNDDLSDVTFTGPPPSIEPAGESGSFGEAEDKTLYYPWAFDDSQVADGYTTPTWEGYDTVVLETPGECDWEWTGDESSAWTDPGNWDGLAGDRYPGEFGDADSVVCIDADDHLPVVASFSGTATIGELHVTADVSVGVQVDLGTLVIEDAGLFTESGLHLGNPSGDTTNRALVVNGTLDVHGDSRWFRGTLTGDGTTTFHGHLDGPADPRTRLLDAHHLVLEGDSNVQNSGFFLADGATLTNRGEMDLGTAVLHDQSIGSTLPLPLLRNEGTIRHSSAVSNWLAVQFDNEATGAVVVEQGTLRLDRFGNNRGDMAVEAGATLQFNLTFPGTTLGPRFISEPSGSITGDGTVHVSTARGLVSEGALDVGSLRLLATGSNRAYLELAADATAGYLEVSNGWPRGAGGTLTVTGNVDYLGRDTSQLFGADGAPMVIDAEGDLWLTSTQPKDFDEETLVTIDGDAVHDQGRVRVIDSEVDVDGTWTMTGEDTLLILDDGTVRSAGMSADADTRIEGIGTIDGTLAADGDVAPGVRGTTAPFGFGWSYGMLHVTDDVTFSASTTFEVRVGGADDGEHDLLHVDTHADIDGAGLVVLLEEDTELAEGDRIPILTTASPTTVSGTFGSEDLPDLPGDLHLEVEYERDAVFLVVAASDEDDGEGEDPVDPEDPTVPEDPTDPEDPSDPDDPSSTADPDDVVPIEADEDDPTDGVAETALPATGAGVGSLVGWFVALLMLGLLALRTSSRRATQRR